MDLELAWRVALITGASQGIGAGIAEVFAEQGCTLRLIARSAENLEQVATDLRARFPVEVQTLAVDLAADGATKRVADWAGEVDILINNAGNPRFGDLWQVDDAGWRDTFNVKLFSAVDLSRLIYPGMKARGFGVILNNIGLAGETFDFNYVVGTSVCAAMTSFTRSLGGGSMNDGVRVVGVSPGPVATPAVTRVFVGEAAERLPGKRIATIREVAELFAFLASPRSGYTSGTVVSLDGGLSSRSVFA